MGKEKTQSFVGKCSEKCAKKVTGKITLEKTAISDKFEFGIVFLL
jgi:hypothetical protein